MLNTVPLNLRSLILCPLLVAGAAGRAAAAELTTGSRWAVLVGVDDYAKLRPLEHAVSDMRGLANQLVASEFERDHVYVLTDDAGKTALLPTKRNIEDRLDLVLSLVKPNDLVVVGFAGHGVEVGGKPYWCPMEAVLDGNDADVAHTLVPLESIYRKLADCPAALRLIIADACRDDPRRTRSGTPMKHDLVAQALANPPEGILVLASCGSGEKSQEDAKLGHGVFTHFLMDGLKGGGDGDGDGTVSLGELFEYAGSRTKKYVADEFASYQSPKLSGEVSPGVLRFPIAAARWAGTGNWPTFRGADRSGVAPDTNLLEAWPAEGPRLVWKTKGAGRGYASLAVAGGRVYTLGDGLSTAEDADEYLTCFNRETGRQLWKTKTGGPWNEGMEKWHGSRSTPTVAGGTVYVLSPFGRLVACTTKDGREIFRVDLKSAFGGKKGDSWGYSESVTVDGDRIICTPGGEQATLVALDPKTGQPMWKCPALDTRGAGHASIVTSTVKGRKIYVQMTASGVLGVDARTGKLLWTYPIEHPTALVTTPIVRDDLVFVTAPWGRGGALLRQVPGPGDEVTIEEVYGFKKELANKHGGIVLVGDHLYGCVEDQAVLFCAELLTGTVVWKERGSGKNSVAVAAADGHLYARFADGTLALVPADPGGYREVSTFTVPGSGDCPSWSHPVIVDGRLYLREGDAILCYDVRAK